jgi:hypothetical protein
MKRVSTLLTVFLSLWIIGCSRKQKVDFAKELSEKIPVGTSQANAEKILDQYGFTHSFDLRTHTIYATKRGEESGFVIVRGDWSAKITLGEEQRVDSVKVDKVFTGP